MTWTMIKSATGTIKYRVFSLTLLFIGLIVSAACGLPAGKKDIAQEQNGVEADLQAGGAKEIESACDWNSLVCTGSMELAYATQFAVDDYGDYRLFTVAGSNRFLLIPEGMKKPDGLPEDVVAVYGSPKRIYLVSTSVMDFMIQLDMLDRVRLSGTRQSGWYLEEAVEAMDAGKMLYAGKYSAPDYERILDQECDLVIENTMIYHTPQVKEQLEGLGIPVLVEYSSYEPEPLGRLEWIKFYGALLGCEQEAETLYAGWLEELEPLLTKKDVEQSPTVAFFYITGNGTVNVRKTQDYIVKLIALAGGRYIFDELEDEEENALSTINIQMEEFYAAAVDADYLIYNSTIDGELERVDDLFAKSELFADFKAVREGRVYCTGRNFFQETTGIGEFARELYDIFATDSEGGRYLYRLTDEKRTRTVGE